MNQPRAKLVDPGLDLRPVKFTVYVVEGEEAVAVPDTIPELGSIERPPGSDGVTENPEAVFTTEGCMVNGTEVRGFEYDMYDTEDATSTES